MKKLSQINEGVMTNTLRRFHTGDVRREDGKTIMTSLGSKIILKDITCDFEKAIKIILNNSIDYDPSVDFESLRYIITPKEEKDKILKGENPTAHIINNENLVVLYSRYDDACDDYDFERTGISKEDYYAVCKCITETLSKCIIDKKKGMFDYYLILATESEIYDWYIDFSRDDEDYLNELKHDICEENGLDMEDISTWSYNGYGGYYIGIDVNYDNLIKYHKIRQYVKEYIGIKND